MVTIHLETDEAVYRFVKPGGYIEFGEYEMDLYSDDGTFHSGLYLWKFYDLVKKAAKKHGLTSHSTPINFVQGDKNLPLTWTN